MRTNRFHRFRLGFIHVPIYIYIHTHVNTYLVLIEQTQQPAKHLAWMTAHGIPVCGRGGPHTPPPRVYAPHLHTTCPCVRNKPKLRFQYDFKIHHLYFPPTPGQNTDSVTVAHGPLQLNQKPKKIQIGYQQLVRSQIES